MKGKKYIVHTYFMLSNTPVWERNSNTDFCILKEKETGAVGRLLQPQAGAGETVLSGYFVSGHLLSCSIWVKADCIMAMLFRNHQTAQILNFSCGVACANGCNPSSFSVPLMISVFLEKQLNAHDSHFLENSPLK